MTTPPASPTPPPPTYTIDIPALREVLVWRPRTPEEIRAMHARMRTRNSAVPDTLSWIPSVINWLDDTEDIISTFLPAAHLLARRIAPRLIPGIGWALTGAELLNVLTQLLGAPLVGRVPKAKAATDLMQAYANRRLLKATSLFPRTVTGWIGYLAEALQASKTLFGYGIQLGGIMAAASDTVWGLIRSAWDGGTVRVRAPAPTDPLGKAWRYLYTTASNLWAFAGLDRDRQRGTMLAYNIAAEHIANTPDPRWDPNRIPTLLDRPRPIIDGPRKRWDELWGDPRPAEETPAPPTDNTNLRPGTRWRDWLDAAHREDARTSEALARHEADDDTTADLAARAALQAIMLGQLADNPDFDPTQPLTKRERWALRVLEAGWLPPHFAQPGDIPMYAGSPQDYIEGRAAYTIRTHGITPPGPEPTYTPPKSPTKATDHFEAIYRRSAAYYSGRLDSWQYWGPHPIHWRAPITITIRRGAPILPPHINAAYPRNVDAWDLGPYAPLAAMLDLYGQAVLRTNRLDDLPGPRLTPFLNRPAWWWHMENWHFRRGPAYRDDRQPPALPIPPQPFWYSHPHPLVLNRTWAHRGAAFLGPAHDVVAEWSEKVWAETI